MMNPNESEPGKRVDSIMSKEAEREFLPLMDVAVLLSRHLRFLVLTFLGFLIAGLIIALLTPTEYSSSARVIREIQSTTQNSPLSALRGLGFGSLPPTTGLNPETIPEIIMTREVTLAVAKEQYYFADVDSMMTYVDYFALTDHISFDDLVKLLKRYTIRLPNTILKKLKGKKTISAKSLTTGQVPLTGEEKDALDELEDMLELNVDQVSGIMDIDVTSEDPVFSATLANSFIQHLTERVREIYTQKSRDQVTFIRARVKEAEMELTLAENALAKFIDSNLGPSEERLQVEIDRLKRKVQFKAQLFQELQSQLTQAELDLQRADPVLTLIEEPIPSPEPASSSAARTVIVLGLLGLVLGPAWILLKDRFRYLQSRGDNPEKFATIRENMAALFSNPGSLFRRRDPDA